jgi:hypothetical protein
MRRFLASSLPVIGVSAHNATSRLVVADIAAILQS